MLREINDAVYTKLYPDSDEICLCRVIAVLEDNRVLAIKHQHRSGTIIEEKEPNQFKYCGHFVKNKRTWNDWFFGEEPSWTYYPCRDRALDGQDFNENLFTFLEIKY